MVCQYVVETVTGKSFADLAQELVFGPLNMTNTTFEVLRETETASNLAHANGDFGLGHLGQYFAIMSTPPFRHQPESQAAGSGVTQENMPFLSLIFKSFKHGTGLLSQELAVQMFNITQDKADSQGLGNSMKREN